MIITGLVIVLVAGLMLLAFMMVIGKSASKPLQKTDLNPQLVASRWHEINAQLHTPSGLRNALIEADKLLDYVMRGRGFRGTTMADRLKSAQSQMRDRDAVWRAHKLRNMMVHEVAIDVVPQQVEQAVKTFGQAIKDLGVPLS